MTTKRDYQKLKTTESFQSLDAPIGVCFNSEPKPELETQMVLRMLVRPKYGSFVIPSELKYLEEIILSLAKIDASYTGIQDSFCYVTVRHGLPFSKTDDEWHFDGASFRVELIPERNYIWFNHTPTEYKIGNLNFPDDFDPCEHNLFQFAEKQLENATIKQTECKKWYLLNPFCLHRRSPKTPNESRTFVRIAFTDVEGRDVNNTQNPLLPTNAFGRDPVKSFRNKLKSYYKD